MQAAVEALCVSVQPYFSKGKARLLLGYPSAHYPQHIQEMEGFCRLLWGLAPLLSTGYRSDFGENAVEGLINGTDPHHPEFWGVPTDYDQRLVEFAAIAYAILIAPEVFWEPLTIAQQAQVHGLLATINKRRVMDANWLLFRVLVNLAFARNGAQFDAAQMKADLDRIESFYLGDGWYSDGPVVQCDYYSSFAIYFYILIYTVYATDLDPERVLRFRAKASEFAQQFTSWFSRDGSALPYGRSLTYRFAQGAFWGAMAFANIGALSSGVIKGFLLRHLRWWASRPIFSETGLLTVGYGYPNLLMAEAYNSASSPYWAMKSFLPVILSERDPFWSDSEQKAPKRPAVVVQERSRMILCTDSEHLFALAGGREIGSRHKHAAEKYSKFCYSTQFGFNVPVGQRSLSAAGHDSALVLSLDGEYFRGRYGSAHIQINKGALISLWAPWPNVEITTLLIPAIPWHVRVHFLRTSISIIAAEGGFALNSADGDMKSRTPGTLPSGCAAVAHTSSGVSLIWDLYGNRAVEVVKSDPNANLLYPRCVIPTLTSQHDPGEHWLVCSVAAATDCSRLEELVESRPSVTLTDKYVKVTQAHSLLFTMHVEDIRSVLARHSTATASAGKISADR